MSEQQNTQKIFSLITDILKAKPEDNVHIRQFHNLVRNDFKDFCNKAVELNQIEDIEVFEKIEKAQKSAIRFLGKSENNK